MTKTMGKKIVIAITIAVTLVAIAWMGFSYAKEAEMKMEAMKYMEQNWYGGDDRVDEITNVEVLDNGHYKVDYTYTTTDGDVISTDAELTI